MITNSLVFIIIERTNMNERVGRILTLCKKCSILFSKSAKNLSSGMPCWIEKNKSVDFLKLFSVFLEDQTKTKVSLLPTLYTGINKIEHLNYSQIQ